VTHSRRQNCCRELCHRAPRLYQCPRRGRHRRWADRRSRSFSGLAFLRRLSEEELGRVAIVDDAHSPPPCPLGDRSHALFVDELAEGPDLAEVGSHKQEGTEDALCGDAADAPA